MRSYYGVGLAEKLRLGLGSLNDDDDDDFKMNTSEAVQLTRFYSTLALHMAY